MPKADGKLGEQSSFTLARYLCNLYSPSIPLFTFLLFFFFYAAKAYSPEFYYDTPNPTLSQKQSKNYSYILQWTQKEPDAVDPILKYRLEVRQVRAAPLVHAFEERTLGAVPSVSPR